MNKGGGRGGRPMAGGAGGPAAASVADLENAFREAVGQFQAGYLDEAEGILAGIRRVQPRIPDVLHLSGVIALRAGRAKDAVRHLRQAVSATPGSAELYNLLGSAQRRDGQTKEALKCLKKAVSLDPELTQAHYNLANALKDMGRLGDAIGHYRRAAAGEPGAADIHFNLGIALKAAGEAEEAEAAYRKALEIAPRDAEVLNNLGTVLMEQERLEEAIDCFDQALASRPQYAEAHHNLGGALGRLDRLDEAARRFRRVAALKPDHFDSHNSLGNVLLRMGRWDDAAAALGKAHALRPDNAEVHSGLALVFREKKQFDQAGDLFQKALSLDPRCMTAHHGLAQFFESTNKLDEARRAVESGLKVEPGHFGINLIAARLARRAGDFEAARDRLSRLEPGSDTPKNLLAQKYYELGMVFDRLAATADAFAGFTEANRLLGQTWRARHADKERFNAFIEDYRRQFTEDWLATWTPAPSGDGTPTPVFLIGFPRSGTTLLGQILDSHPDLHVIEEEPLMDAVRTRLIAEAKGQFPASLAGLSAEEIQLQRRTYFQQAGEFLSDGATGTVVDKLPLSTVEAGLIHRIFPDAKFIFALRHPCDACLSCFMQDFEINNAMAHFLSMEDTAALYAKVMTLWQDYERLLPLSVHRIRYEDLVEDFETEVRRLLEFLGVGWDDAVLDYASNATKRKQINTPSYNQVTETIYTRAKYRWLRYREQLAPVIDDLMLWARRFGYDDPSEIEGQGER